MVNKDEYIYSSRTTKQHHCKHDVTWICSSCGSALKIDPSKMAWSFSWKLSNSSPVQKNGSKTWTGELLDTLQESRYMVSWLLSDTICSTQHRSTAGVQ